MTGIDVEQAGRDRRRVRGVQTEWGPIEAEVVVDAGGMFAAEIARMAGVRVPIVPFAHEYLVTQPFRERVGGPDGIVHLPTLRDPDLLIYFREEGGGLVMGGYERRSAPWALDERPARCDSPGLQRQAARRGLAAFRGDRRELAGAGCPRWTRSRSRG